MAIIETVNEWQFIKAFDEIGRSEQFSRPARRALFEYLDGLSEDLNENIEIDPIALCCEWSEYSETELMEQFGHLIEAEDIDDLVEELQDHTTVLFVEDIDDRYLLQDF